MNESCYRYIDGIIINRLKSFNNNTIGNIFINLNELYNYFVDYGYVFKNYEYEQFEHFEADLLQLLDDAGYCYFVTIQKNSSTILTIEMKV